MLDAQPNAVGVSYPDRQRPEIPEGAVCQEVLGMVGDRYLRCGDPADAVIAWPREIYWMCAYHATHSVVNRGARLLVPQEKEGNV